MGGPAVTPGRLKDLNLARRTTNNAHMNLSRAWHSCDTRSRSQQASQKMLAASSSQRSAWVRCPVCFQRDCAKGHAKNPTGGGWKSALPAGPSRSWCSPEATDVTDQHVEHVKRCGRYLGRLTYTPHQSSARLFLPLVGPSLLLLLRTRILRWKCLLVPCLNKAKG